MTTARGQGLFWFLMLIVAVTPLPFGSDQQWSSSLLGALTGVLLVFWAMSAWRDRSLVRLRSQRVRVQVWVFGLVILWYFLQVSALTPESWHNPIWGEVNRALDLDVGGRIAIAPDIALRSIMRILAYAGVFWVTLHFCRQEVYARRTLWVIAVCGFCYAVYGLIIHLGDYNMVVWREKWTFLHSLTSTFVYRATYATYAGLGIVVSLALLLNYMLVRPAASPLQKLSSRSIESWGFGPWFLLGNLFVLGSALLLSNSRGGLAATVAGVACLIAVAVVSGRMKRRQLIAVGSATIVVCSVLIALSGSDIIQRFADFTREPDHKIGDFGRGTVFQWAFEEVEEQPLLGTGLGGFTGTFYAHRDARFGDTDATYFRAHNTYLETAMDSGLPAALALMLVIGSFAWVCVRGLKQPNGNAVYPMLGLAATTVVGVHSLYDFSMEVPGVAVTYFAILGASVAQSWPLPKAVQRVSAAVDPDSGRSEPPRDGPKAADKAPG